MHRLASQFAQYCENALDIEDLQKFKTQEILEIVIRAVNGLGDAGVNYLFMLAGDPD